uniref:Uncharacterized protein n=1 Tax=Romanomermis culicivorax TaxID=13658 RepID=A0A915KCL2_ROMCU
MAAPAVVAIPAAAVEPANMATPPANIGAAKPPAHGLEHTLTTSAENWLFTWHEPAQNPEADDSTSIKVKGLLYFAVRAALYRAVRHHTTPDGYFENSNALIYLDRVDNLPAGRRPVWTAPCSAVRRMISSCYTYVPYGTILDFVYLKHLKKTISLITNWLKMTKITFYKAAYVDPRVALQKEQICIRYVVGK